MQVDLFTVIAQIVNFLILVWLLKRFLYGRIVRAMDEREERIASELHEAEESRREADRKASEYEERLAELDDEREDVLSRARAEAEERKREMLDEARSEVEERRARWHESLEEEKESFVKGLTERASSEILAISGAIVSQIADSDVESRAVSAFRRKLDSLDGEERNRFREAISSEGGPVIAESARELDDDSRAVVREIVRGLIERDVEIKFRTEPSHVLGIVVKTEGYQIGWTAGGYVTDLRERLAEELEERTAEDEAHAAGENEERAAEREESAAGEGQE